MAWILLVGAGLLEIVWAMALKHAAGFTRLWPSLIGIAAAIVSFVMLSASLKVLPVGTAYAVWVGVGALGVAGAGILLLGESASPARLLCLGLILIGIVGLKYVGEAG
jgi:quaternary ammonium compound-resistance protein SugE